jgi:16S rRNA (guanine527-N7)-methyltransferase
VIQSDFRGKVSLRARAAGLVIPDRVFEPLERYFRLLAQWNQKINLTALPLQQPTDETIDRLLVEPLAAASYVEISDGHWLDIGSGGGSPAVPMKILHSALDLTMVESRERKAAFLREVVRELGLSPARVENDRFERLTEKIGLGNVDLATVRAVKGDERLFDSIRRLLTRSGRLMVFHSPGASVSPPGFNRRTEVSLGTTGDARLTILEALFHVEQSR